MSASRYPERVRYYRIDYVKGCTYISNPKNGSTSIEYSTNLKLIKKIYNPLILKVEN